MNITQLDTTNILLGILAGLAVAQMLAGIVVIVWLRRAVSRVSQASSRFESEYLHPIAHEAQQLASQARQVIADVQPIVGRVDTILRGIESRTRHALTAVDAVNEQVDAVVHSGLTQLRAIEHGFRRGVEALVNSSNHR